MYFISNYMYKNHYIVSYLVHLNGILNFLMSVKLVE